MTVFKSLSFCKLFHLLSVSVLFPPDLSSWRKAKPFLGHNLWASCTTSPALLLPLWSYPCLSLSLSVSCLLLFFFFKLYNIVLGLPNIEMNPSQVYLCSPSWTLLPPPSPYPPSGLSQCTSPKHPVSWTWTCLAFKRYEVLILSLLPNCYIFLKILMIYIIFLIFQERN